jgi:ribonuclease BN (tRNA processing enzyme)
MMKVTILGAGVAASDYLQDKKLNRYPPAFLITWGKEGKLLFDCSAGVDRRLEQAGYDYASIQHIAISHPHPDHAAPIHFYQSVFCKGLWGGIKNPELTFYGPDYLIENFNTLWKIYTPNEEGNYFEWPKLTLQPMSAGNKSYDVYDGMLTARKVYHAYGKCDAVSYRLETPEGIIAYSGDTGDCDGIREIVKNADIFLCEASARIGDFTSPKEYGHLNPFVAADIAQRGNVKKIIFFHYTGHDSDEEMIKDARKAGFTGDVICGKDFQDISVN